MGWVAFGYAVSVTGKGRRSGQRSRWAGAAHSAVRGAVGAMSMTGMRALAARLGWLEQTPPEMVTYEHGPEVLQRMSEQQREGVIIILHWAYGAGGGATFGLLPDRIRLKPWAGPAFGVAMWLGFELAIVPALGLELRKQHSTKERLALAADHLLYGAVLSEFRRRPRE